MSEGADVSDIGALFVGSGFGVRTAGVGSFGDEILSLGLDVLACSDDVAPFRDVIVTPGDDVLAFAEDLLA